jgi:H+/Cl- antiporter ClcA
MKISGSEPLRGNNKFLKAINTAHEKKSYLAVLVNLLAAIMTIAFGRSAGRAGPSAQIGSALSRKFSDTLHLNEEDRLLMKLCGISAGFAAVLGAPLAGIVLSLEIMKPGKRLLSMLLPIGISAFASTAVGSLLPYSSILLPYSSILLPYSSILLPGSSILLPGSSHHIAMNPQLSVNLLFQALLGGLFFAAVSFTANVESQTCRTAVSGSQTLCSPQGSPGWCDSYLYGAACLT